MLKLGSGSIEIPSFIPDRGDARACPGYSRPQQASAARPHALRAGEKGGSVMKQVLISLIDSLGQQSLAITGIADQVSALKATLMKYNPEMQDDFKAQLAVEKEASRTYIAHMQKQLAELRAVASRLSN
jgi:hypothetical protein